MGPETGALEKLKPNLQNSGFTAISTEDTVMGVNLGFLYIFTKQKKSMGQKLEL